MSTINILLTGVGGQGIILASDLLSNLALHLGLDVKKSEIHGMSQRGGSVESHVRIGKKVLSPLIPKGEADFMISMEQSEVLRHMDYPKKDAAVVASTFRVIPPSVTNGDETYPSGEEIEGELEKHFSKVAMLDVPAIMREVGNMRTANIILLGALSNLLPYPQEAWTAVLEKSLKPKILAVNLKAFEAGRVAGATLAN